MSTREQELEKDVRQLLGLPPYDHPANFCWNDNYFAKSLDSKYGETAVRKMIATLRKAEGRTRS